MIKSRFFFLLKETNKGKVEELNLLQDQYTAYLQSCVDVLLSARKFSVKKGTESRVFFPTSEILSSQIAKNCQQHAIEKVTSWASNKYNQRIKKYISKQVKEGTFSKDIAKILYTIGKYSVQVSTKNVSQEHLDFYWKLLLDESISGKKPTITNRVGMRMSINTGIMSESESTKITKNWLAFSWLKSGAGRIQLPLSNNPLVKSLQDVSKGILARKTRKGVWRFEVVDKKEWEIQEPSEDCAYLGIDVGLNVIAATSEGTLYGKDTKPIFDEKYSKIKEIRSNRQRQGLVEDSGRVATLEENLTGFLKTVVGNIANKLVKKHPNTVFVVEDLDLSGTKGQKRFCYLALINALSSKAVVEKVNPAYTSQICPSCGYVNRRNRVGIKFKCRSCGRTIHADVVGGVNLLRRSKVKQVGTALVITLSNTTSEVKEMLEALYWKRRNSNQDCSQGFLNINPNNALEPHSQKLTVEESTDLCTASKQMFNNRFC